MSDTSGISVIHTPASQFTKAEERAMPIVPGNTDALSMIALAVQKGMDPATIKNLLDLRDRMEATEALKAFNVAFAGFKAEAINIIKNRTVDAGPLKDKKYAELYSVVNAVTPALSKHGLSASWKLTKDEPSWIEITCTMKHALGHSEAVSMGGPPDDGGAKSKIQARASTVSYLERYTLKAVCGVAESGDDKDGGEQSGGMGDEAIADYIAQMEACADLAALQKAWTVGYKIAQDLGDRTAMGVINRAKDARKAAMKKKAAPE